MEFLIRKAGPADVRGIMRIMEQAGTCHIHPDWFVADDETYVSAHLEQKGFIVVAEASDGEIAGFFIVKYPDKDDNLGTCLGFDDRQLSQVAVMDSTAVDNAFRGNGLQGRMLETAENLLDPDRFVYLMCTVHPENRFSRHNMESHGYQVKKIARCYSGLERCILLKERGR